MPVIYCKINYVWKFPGVTSRLNHRYHSVPFTRPALRDRKGCFAMFITDNNRRTANGCRYANAQYLPSLIKKLACSVLFATRWYVLSIRKNQKLVPMKYAVVRWLMIFTMERNQLLHKSSVAAWRGNAISILNGNQCIVLLLTCRGFGNGWKLMRFSKKKGASGVLWLPGQELYPCSFTRLQPTILNALIWEPSKQIQRDQLTDLLYEVVVLHFCVLRWYRLCSDWLTRQSGAIYE